MKYLLSNEYQKAKVYVEALEGMRNDKGLRLKAGYGLVLNRILNSSEKSVNEGEMLEHHEIEYPTIDFV